MKVTLLSLAAFVSAVYGAECPYSPGLYNESPLNHTCTIQKPLLSCSAQASDPSASDVCCNEAYGGLVLATQFWSTYTGLESQGQLLPPKSWTLHGLWPDFCNGSYTQYCDLSRQYDPRPSPNTTNGLKDGTPVPAWTGDTIDNFAIKKFGKYDLLDYMNKYWINQGAPNTEFWAHEFSKHATCFSTFDVPCYGPRYVRYQEVVDFFETSIRYYLKVPTYDWLSKAGIVPSNSTTYTLSSFQNTLTKAYGALPYTGCSGPRFNDTAAGKGSLDNGRTVLSEVWYYSHVLGRPQDGNWVPVNATFVTTCAQSAGAISYPERTRGSEW